MNFAIAKNQNKDAAFLRKQLRTKFDAFHNRKTTDEGKEGIQGNLHNFQTTMPQRRQTLVGFATSRKGLAGCM